MQTRPAGCVAAGQRSKAASTYRRRGEEQHSFCCAPAWIIKANENAHGERRAQSGARMKIKAANVIHTSYSAKCGKMQRCVKQCIMGVGVIVRTCSTLLTRLSWMP